MHVSQMIPTLLIAASMCCYAMSVEAKQAAVILWFCAGSVFASTGIFGLAVGIIP